MIKSIIKLIAPFLLIALFSMAVIIAFFFAFGWNEERGLKGASLEAAAQKDDNVFSLLVIGKDKASALADVIMLVSFDKESEKACVLQIPRDTYAEYGNDNYYKINGAVKTLGADGACDFFEEALGIELDGYISLDLEGFRNAVDAVGGVEMTVERDLKYSDPSQGLYINLKRGRQTLDGREAEMLVRYRSGYIRGDLDRLDTQKSFLMAMVLGLKEKINFFNAYSVANAIIPHIETDIDIPSLVEVAVSGLSVSEENICFATLPGEDTVSETSGASFYVMSAEPARELIGEYFSVVQGAFDGKGAFLNSNSEQFKKIYESKKEKSVFFINDLK